MPRIQEVIKIFFFAFTLTAAITCTLPQASVAQTRARIQGNTPQDFVDFFCVNVKVKPGELQALVRALQDLLASLEFIRLDLGSFGVELNPPSACLPNFNFNFNIPGLDGLLACMNQINLKIDIQPPDLSGVGQCLAGLLPSLDLQLPNFNPQSMLSCLGNINANIDLSSLLSSLNNIIRAISEIVEALKHLLPTIEALIDPNFLLSIKWLNNYCRKNRARYR